MVGPLQMTAGEDSLYSLLLVEASVMWSPEILVLLLIVLVAEASCWYPSFVCHLARLVFDFFFFLFVFNWIVNTSKIWN